MRSGRHSPGASSVTIGPTRTTSESPASRTTAIIDARSTGPVDLASMIAVVREAGLSLVVRVGPMVTDDAPGLCLPERIFTDRKYHARTRRQNPVLVPDPPRL